MDKLTTSKGLFVRVAITLLFSLLVAPALANTRPKDPASKIPDATKSRIQGTFFKSPLTFEANQGQTDSQVKFLARGNGYALFLTPTEAVMVLRKPNDKPRAMRDPRFWEKPSEISPQNSSLQSIVRMKLAGANDDPNVVGLVELPGKVNYFKGNDPRTWRTNVSTYAKVEYRDVYPGINLVYYGNQRQLEYDFVVSPGSDPSVIQLAFEGTDKIEVDAEGDLILRTALGDLKMHKPLVYQEVAGVREPIAAAYVEYPTSIAIDALGSAYVTGYTGSADFPTSGSLQPFLGDDAFVTKFNAEGSSVIYSTYLGGSDIEWGNSIAVDRFGDAYVRGDTDSNDFPTTPSAFQVTLKGRRDAFVAKLNSTGSALIYSTYLGGSDYESVGGGSVSVTPGRSLAVDFSGNAYLTGLTLSNDFPTTPGSVQTSCALHNGFCGDAFITKLNASGTALVYSSYIGGTFTDEGTGIAIDSDDNAYITGITNSSDFPVSPDAFDTTCGTDGNCNSDRRAFVTKVNATGSAILYSTYLGGSGAGGDATFGIAVDGAGNAYVTGFTTSFNFPVTAGVFQATGGGARDAFITKLNAAGTALIYSTYLGGSNGDEAYSIAIDSSGSAYVMGGTSSANFPTARAIQSTKGFLSDAFITKLTPDGTALNFSTYLGGNGEEALQAGGFGAMGSLAVDSSGNAYVTGQTFSSDFPITTGAFQTFRNGPIDGFVVKIADVLPLPILSATPPSLNFGTVTVGTSLGETFTVQNTGGGTLTGSASTSAPFSIVGNDTFNLAANQSTDITVRFSPTIAGSANAFVNFTSNGGNAALAVTGTGVLADTDGDGMPDQWEILYGLNPNDSSDADLDADGDGVTNYFEYVLGTSPLSPSTFGPLVPDPILTTPRQPTVGTCSVKSPQARNLLVIIHGWNGSPTSWPKTMAEGISEKIADRGVSTDWDICAYDWEDDASPGNIPFIGWDLLDAEAAWKNAGVHGLKLGNELFQKGYNHIHFIAHSAGSNLLQTAVETILVNYESLHAGLTSSCNFLPIPTDCLLPKPTIHSTFLDAYVAEILLSRDSGKRHGSGRYGRHAQWAEHYVSKTIFGDDTDPILTNAFNFDVTDLNPSALSKTNPLTNHFWPHEWYDKTIDGSDPDSISALGFGFPMSIESGGQLPSHDPVPGRYYKRGEECDLKTEASNCGTVPSSPPRPSVYTTLAMAPLTNFSALQPGTDVIASNTGTVTFPNSTTAQMAMGSPVWLSIRLNTPSPANILQFRYQFLAGLSGLLSVFVDGKLVLRTDQRFALPGVNTASEIWLGDVLPGQHVLSFRLDAFDATQAIIEISNVQTGLMELVTNTLPLANAGANQTVRLGSLVTLNGSGSADPDNAPGPLTYFWTKVSGPAVTLSGATTATPILSPPVAGTYTYSLVVNDGQDNSVPANVSITVPVLGDIDLDGDVDNNDLNLIMAARNTLANGPNDLRDLNGDGKIDVLDARKLVTLCTRARCATQ